MLTTKSETRTSRRSHHKSTRTNMAETQVKIITLNPQQIQGEGNKNQIQDRSAVKGVIGRKLLTRNEHQDYVGERKRKGDTERHRKLFAADIAEQSKIRSQNDQ